MNTSVKKGCLKKKTIPSLQPIKDSLNSNKDEPRVGQFYFCDHCNKPILLPSQGIVIHGNIYEANPAIRGGLIGNNFPDVKPGDKIEVTDIKETAICLLCLDQILGRTNSYNRSRTDPL